VRTVCTLYTIHSHKIRLFIQIHGLPHCMKSRIVSHELGSLACVRDQGNLHAIIKACAEPIFHTLSLDPSKFSKELMVFSVWAKMASVDLRSFGPPRGMVTCSETVYRWLIVLTRPRKAALEDHQSSG
jgi:hypothetical protein